MLDSNHYYIWSSFCCYYSCLGTDQRFCQWWCWTVSHSMVAYFPQGTIECNARPQQGILGWWHQTLGQALQQESKNLYQGQGTQETVFCCLKPFNIILIHTYIILALTMKKWWESKHQLCFNDVVANPRLYLLLEKASQKDKQSTVFINLAGYDSNFRSEVVGLKPLDSKYL